MIDLARFVPTAQQHALDALPHEACALIVERDGALHYVACRNAARTASDHFDVHPDDLAEAEDAGRIAAIVHSHPFAAPEPSQADRVACEAWGVPWLIVNAPVGHYRVLMPEGYLAPLVGREYCYGVNDCYTLLRDYYAQVLGIPLPDFWRSDDEWWVRGEELFLEGYEEAGFVRCDDLRAHDVLLMQVASPKSVNHCGVLVEDNVLLHHLYNKPSCRTTYGGYWRKCTRLVLRHRSLL